jgi:hypothetical protein
MRHYMLLDVERRGFTHFCIDIVKLGRAQVVLERDPNNAKGSNKMCAEQGSAPMVWI